MEWPGSQAQVSVSAGAVGAAIVAEVSSWEGQGSIYRLRIPAGDRYYVTRAQLAPARADHA